LCKNLGLDWRLCKLLLRDSRLCELSLRELFDLFRDRA